MYNAPKTGAPQPQQRMATDAVQALSDFEMDVVRAKNSGSEWLETPDLVIKYLYPSGLGVNPVTKKPMEWFWYKNQKCCLPGRMEAIEKEMEMTTQDRMGDPLPGTDSLVVK